MGLVNWKICSKNEESMKSLKMKEQLCGPVIGKNNRKELIKIQNSKDVLAINERDGNVLSIDH